MRFVHALPLAFTAALFSQVAQAAPADPAPSAPASSAPASSSDAAPAAAAPDAIDVYFDEGSAHIRPADLAELDHAARLYRDGKPILMTVAGGADATGSPEINIRISQLRANAVFQGLVARGIPPERFQILAKGATDPAVPSDGANPRNRRVEITWK